MMTHLQLGTLQPSRPPSLHSDLTYESPCVYRSTSLFYLGILYVEAEKHVSWIKNVKSVFTGRTEASHLRLPQLRGTQSSKAASASYFRVDQH